MMRGDGGRWEEMGRAAGEMPAAGWCGSLVGGLALWRELLHGDCVMVGGSVRGVLVPMARWGVVGGSFACWLLSTGRVLPGDAMVRVVAGNFNGRGERGVHG